MGEDTLENRMEPLAELAIDFGQIANSLIYIPLNAFNGISFFSMYISALIVWCEMD